MIPRQGKFCVPGSAQAPSVPLNIFPYGLASPARRPAALSAAAGGGDWVRKCCVTVCDCWKVRPPKGFPLREAPPEAVVRCRPCNGRKHKLYWNNTTTANVLYYRCIHLDLPHRTFCVTSPLRALSIRHSRFAALTLAKLVASLALHLP